MASTYPTSLDVFTNPLAADPLTTPSHAQQHSDINDAVEALEAKVAIGNTVLGTYTAFTPTIGGFTLGNGTLTSSFCRVNNFVHYFGRVVWGSTSSVVSSFSIDFPVVADTTFNQLYMMSGTCGFRDVSAASNSMGFANCNGGSQMFVQTATASGTYVQPGGISPTVPFTWATGDFITWNIYYKAA